MDANLKAGTKFTEGISFYKLPWQQSLVMVVQLMVVLLSVVSLGRLCGCGCCERHDLYRSGFGVPCEKLL